MIMSLSLSLFEELGIALVGSHILCLVGIMNIMVICRECEFWKVKGGERRQQGRSPVHGNK